MGVNDDDEGGLIGAGKWLRNEKKRILLEEGREGGVNDNEGGGLTTLTLFDKGFFYDPKFCFNETNGIDKKWLIQIFSVFPVSNSNVHNYLFLVI